MDRAQLQEKIISIIREQKTIADDVLTPEAPLRDAGIDSLDALNILFGLEETFNISIPDDDARQIQSLSDMVDLVERLRADSGQATSA